MIGETTIAKSPAQIALNRMNDINGTGAAWARSSKVTRGADAKITPITPIMTARKRLDRLWNPSGRI